MNALNLVHHVYSLVHATVRENKGAIFYFCHLYPAIAMTNATFVAGKKCDYRVVSSNTSVVFYLILDLEMIIKYGGNAVIKRK